MELRTYNGPDLRNCMEISTEKFPDGSGLLSFTTESGAEITMSVGRLISSPDEWAKTPVLDPNDRTIAEMVREQEIRAAWRQYRDVVMLHAPCQLPADIVALMDYFPSKLHLPFFFHL